MKGLGRVAKNTLILTTLKLVVPLISMALVLIISRYLGAEGLGRYTLVSSFFYMFSEASFLGLHAIIARDGARLPDRLPTLLGNAAILGGGASLVCTGLMGALGNWLAYDNVTHVAMLVLGLALLPSTLLTYYEAAFTACERMDCIALSTLTEYLVKVGLSAGLLLLGHGIIAVMIVALGARWLACLLSMVLLARLGVSLRVLPDRRVLRQLAVAAPTFTLITVFSLLYWKIDLFMLSKLGDMHDVGLYSAGYRLLEIVMVLPQSFCLAVYPRLVRALHTAPETLVRLGATALRYLTVITLPLATGATLLAEPIITLLYGEALRPAAMTLAVLVWTVVPYAWVRYYAYVLVATNRQRIDLQLNVAMAGVNVALNLVLIPQYGPLGAALATFVSIVLFAVSQYVYMRQCLAAYLAVPSTLLKSVGATVIMGVFVWWLRYMPVPSVVVMAALLYFGTLLLSRFFTADEIAMLRLEQVFARVGLRSVIKWASIKQS